MYKEFHLFTSKREMDYESHSNWLNEINKEIDNGVVLLPNFITYVGIQSPKYVTIDCGGLPPENLTKG